MPGRLIDEITRTTDEFDASLGNASTTAQLDELRVRYFGRKGGLIPAFFSRLKEVPKDQKREIGDALNKLRDHAEEALKAKSERIAAEESARREAREEIDVT